MKYCKKCGVLYSSELPCCPKCNPALEELPKDAPPADRRVVRRQWIALLIGIPALILVLYALIYGMRALGA